MAGVKSNLADALHEIPIFSDLDSAQLAWFAQAAEDLHLNSGDFVIHQGDPADYLFVILEGEIRIRRPGTGGDRTVFLAGAGEVTGMLPFSRLKLYGVVARAVLQARIARLHKDKFPEMMERIPQLTPRLVALLADRVREVTKADTERDKLAALGKLSAGLAHELNNPASAARRAAEGLRDVMTQVRATNIELDRHSLSSAQRAVLSKLEQDVIDGLESAQPLDALAQSDREEEISSWLQRRGVPEPWKLATPLVEAGIDPACLAALAGQFSGELLPDVLVHFSSVVTAARLVGEIEHSTARISDLVRAIKEYSYMDQGSEQEIDVHQGIDNTLIMLKFRLKHGVNVTREYDKDIPPICARGSELNQVWTNLIENAVDAMNGSGELRIRTRRDWDAAIIEIEDNGPGIPDAVKGRIFEPFFTTKGVGEGTGLGLDTAYRIVRNHSGEISVTSVPGKTCFQIRLPFKRPKEATV